MRRRLGPFEDTLDAGLGTALRDPIVAGLLFDHGLVMDDALEAVRSRGARVRCRRGTSASSPTAWGAAPKA